MLTRPVLWWVSAIVRVVVGMDGWLVRWVAPREAVGGRIREEVVSWVGRWVWMESKVGIHLDATKKLWVKRKDGNRGIRVLGSRPSFSLYRYLQQHSF